jgi:hypothetical protein
MCPVTEGGRGKYSSVCFAFKWPNYIIKKNFAYAQEPLSTIGVVCL